MTKRYVQLRCSICARERDSLINFRHYTPDRCTITLGCEGRLSPVGQTSDGSMLTSIPPIGLENWYARGSTSAKTAELATPRLYSTSTGVNRQLMVAVSDQVLGLTPDSSGTLTVNLVAEQQQARDYRQYTFRKTGSFTIVNGVEAALAKKVLRYTSTGVNPDVVEVYVDGVKRSQGTGDDQFQLYDGTAGSPVPPNSVLFNSAVTGVVSQVDVIVTKAVTLSTLSLTFTRATDDDSRQALGAWEGVGAVKQLGSRWSLFYCDFSEIPAAPVDVRLRLDQNAPSTLVQGNTTMVIPGSAMAILFARSGVHTHIDRLRGVWAPLSTLTLDVNYLVIKLTEGVRELLITEDSIVDVFPPLEVQRYNAPALLRTSLKGNKDSAQIDGDLIIGPDA